MTREPDPDVLGKAVVGMSPSRKALATITSEPARNSNSKPLDPVAAAVARPDAPAPGVPGRPRAHL